MLRPAPLVAVLAVAFSFACAACGGSGKPAPAAPKAPVDPPGLVKLRTAYAAFAASPMAAADFDTLASAHDAEREKLEPAGRAEADLIVAFAGVTILEKHLDPLAEPDNAAHDLMAATVLPVVWQARPLDGESAPAFRDRLCQGPGATACANVLPDFWGAALAYEAAKQLDARARTLSEACACAARYGSELTRARALAEAAKQHDADQRPGWGLDMDNLARSAFATPELPPGDVRVKVRAAELLPGKRKAIAAKLAERRAAAAAPPEGGAHVLEVEALADGKPADLTLLAQAARDAGFAAVLLVVRVAAPPNPRGFLRVELAAPRAPKGTTALALSGKTANMQALVDQIDAAFGTSDHARVVWVVK
jgi:hypothetical protein